MIDKRTCVEFDDDDGTTLRYFQHVNGGGLVESTADVDPTAYIGPSAYIDAGACVEAGARVASAAWIERDGLVCAGATVGHAAHVGAHAVVGPGARLGARVRLDDGVRIARCAYLDSDTIVHSGRRPRPAPEPLALIQVKLTSIPKGYKCCPGPRQAVDDVRAGSSRSEH